MSVGLTDGEGAGVAVSSSNGVRKEVGVFVERPVEGAMSVGLAGEKI